jgi:purine-binding chemotaxis protein CheW
MGRLLLVARMAGERIAIPAAAVESVVEIEALTPVPRAAPHVAGLGALRSRVLTVIDCRAALGAAPGDVPREGIVVLVDGHAYALAVDAVEDVVEAEGEPAPAPATLSPEWRRVASGMAEIEGALLLIVDPQALVAGPVVAAACA